MMRIHPRRRAGWLALPIALAVSSSSLAEGELEAFDASVAEVKGQYRQIEALWSEYQTADVDRQRQIDEAIKPLLAQTKKKVKVMEQAALEAFMADPGGDKGVTDLLVELAKNKVVGSPRGGGDQYESALPIIEALAEAGVETPGLAIWGLFTAVNTNDFESAERFAKQIKSSGALENPPGQGAEGEVAMLAMNYLAELPAQRAKWEAELKVREAEAVADDLPRVKVTTSKGDVVIELFENEAPIAVANFLSLVKEGFYDDIVFHRVLARFMAQGGDPTGSGMGGPGYTIPCECYKPEARKHFRGTLSMAHAGRDTGGSQFFLTFVPTNHLDGRHTVFGRVIEGFDVLGELQYVDPQARGGAEPDKILSAEVIRDRGHDYAFDKLPGR